ncbi:MAG: EI24 domain-containing protein [Alphaproteobacteria bacterium]|nr:EI24 domain-containing protein [Alphaproteobacteria bacterium]MBU0796595.1 EI24 domain-containing protein [Alphaproteobacteria bacterium]MBU0886336.1 EI24 domain-containing protein [Alphaproteobacteria bacterium]MBU1813468.1 EI24 domain-containing protein [Alphaproteobacteria bacterium]
MFAAFTKALQQLSDPRLRGIVWRGVLVALSVFVGLFILVNWSLSGFGPDDVGLPATIGEPVAWTFRLLVDILGGLAVLVLTWLLFPAVATAVMGLFLDDAADAIEQRDYPALPAARRQPMLEAFAVAARFLALSILLNLIALPVYLLLPAVNLVLFYFLNGYLISREYFDMVAIRRVDKAEIVSMRRAYRGRLLGFGAVIAFLMTVPLVNLFVPVFATATMVHLFQGLRRKGIPA